MIGIYVIINEQNEHKYVGSSIDIINRWIWHVHDFQTDKHPNKKLQSSWKKYGEESFTFNILEECSKEDLIKREQYWIDELKPEYNICKIAGSWMGNHHSEETKRMWSIKRKGSIPWNKGKKTGPLKGLHRQKVINAGTRTLIAFNKSKIGTHLSEEHKKKVSQALKGRIFTKEHRRKLSEATKKFLNSGACPI